MNNVVEKFKKGHKIHIKESQKGSFTKWCGGNVTNECIQRGKNSSNPKIRKKATFAQNARRWKHKEGGKIDFYNLGGWFKNTFNNVTSFLGTDMGQSLLSTGKGLWDLGKGVMASGQIADQANAQKEFIDAQERADKSQAFAQKYAGLLQEKLSNPVLEVNGSPIHTNGVNVANEAYNQAINTFNFDNSKYNQMRLQAARARQAQENQNMAQMMGTAGNLINSIGGISASILNNQNKTATA